MVRKVGTKHHQVDTERTGHFIEIASLFKFWSAMTIKVCGRLRTFGVWGGLELICYVKVAGLRMKNHLYEKVVWFLVMHGCRS